MPYIEVIRKNGKQGARVAPCFFCKKSRPFQQAKQKNITFAPLKTMG